MESTKDNPKDRVEDDKTEIKKVLEKINLVTIFRAGKKSDKARPLVVKLCNKELRDDIISKGKPFKTATNVTVLPDLTYMQRQNLSSLSTEA